MTRTLTIVAVLVLAGCLGSGATAETTPTATPTPTPDPTPTPTPEPWEEATPAQAGVVYDGELGDVTEFVRVDESATITIQVQGSSDQRVQVAYSAEAKPPTVLELHGGETHTTDVQPGAYGFEMQAIAGGPVPVRVEVTP